MAPIRRFEDIEGWQKSLALDQEFSRMAGFSTFKDPYLRDQMGRSVESAMANIAEGFDAGSNPEFVRFLNIAYRSLTEFQSHLHVCKTRACLTQREFDRLYGMAKEAKSKVGGFIRYLKAHPRGKKCCPAKNPELRTNPEPRTKNS